MADNDISVTDTSIGGKFVGRDDNSLTYAAKYEQSVYLAKLYEELQQEKELNTSAEKTLEEFDYYNSPVENDKVLGLDAKLIAGNREKILWFAKSAKERYHKKLMRTSQYSAAAQKINVHILGKVKSSFMMEVYTLICSGASEERINLMITERIINPVMAELGANVFGYNAEEILGMIFFLTGNCHIKWTE